VSEEIAAAISLLASEDASYITEINLLVDGGLTASIGLAPFYDALDRCATRATATKSDGFAKHHKNLNKPL
jgi:hypothetical protein